MTSETPGVGHNGGPGLYLKEIGKLQAIDAVLKDRRFNQTEALVLIGLIIRSSAEYRDAFPGGATLALYAKVKRTDTVFNALKRLEEAYGVIHRESRGNGRSNSYTVMPQKIVDAIVKEYEDKKAARTTQTQTVETGGLGETHPPEAGRPVDPVAPSNRVGSVETQTVETGGSSKQPTQLDRVGSETHPVKAGATHPVKAGAYPFHIQEEEKKEGADAPPPPKTKNQFVGVNWTSALNPYSAADAEDVFWVDDCKIQVVNGFKHELEEQFPNVNLMAGLSIVAGEALPTETGTALKRRIRRKFGYLQNEEGNRDRRAKEARSRPSGGAAQSGKEASKHSRLREMVEDAVKQQEEQKRSGRAMK